MSGKTAENLSQRAMVLRPVPSGPWGGIQ